MKQHLLKTAKTTWLVIKKSITRFVGDQGFLVANGLAFKTIFAIIPVIAIVFGIFTMFDQFSAAREAFIELIYKFIVPESVDIVIIWLDQFLSKTGTISIIGVIFFIYLSLDLFISLDNQVDRIWDTKQKRPIIQKILTYWALLTGMPVVMVGYFYYSGLFRSFLVSFAQITYLDEILYSLFAFIILEAFIFLIYFIIPNTKVHFIKAIIISSGVSFAWILLRFVFTYYTGLVINNWRIYGSVAAIIFFMIWVSINWLILLLGIEFLCVWQNRLYKGNIQLKKFFLYDVGFFMMVLQTFHQDFLHHGHGLTISSLADKFNYDRDDLKDVIMLFEDAGLIIGDSNPVQHFYIRKDINNIKLSDIEAIIWKRLSRFNYRNTPQLQQICNKLGKYYLERGDESVVYLNEILLSPSE
jgi:membrane protein